MFFMFVYICIANRDPFIKKERVGWNGSNQSGPGFPSAYVQFFSCV